MPACSASAAGTSACNRGVGGSTVAGGDARSLTPTCSAPCTISFDCCCMDLCVGTHLKTTTTMTTTTTDNRPATTTTKRPNDQTTKQPNTTKHNHTQPTTANHNQTTMRLTATAATAATAAAAASSNNKQQPQQQHQQQQQQRTTYNKQQPTNRPTDQPTNNTTTVHHQQHTTTTQRFTTALEGGDWYGRSPMETEDGQAEATNNVPRGRKTSVAGEPELFQLSFQDVLRRYAARPALSRWAAGKVSAARRGAVSRCSCTADGPDRRPFGGIFLGIDSCAADGRQESFSRHVLRDGEWRGWEGLGVAKLLMHMNTGKVQFTMRRVKTLKVKGDVHVERVAGYCEMKPYAYRLSTGPIEKRKQNSWRRNLFPQKWPCRSRMRSSTRRYSTRGSADLSDVPIKSFSQFADLGLGVGGGR